jgi:hypothetical protein
VLQREQISWNLAAFDCRKRGTRLVSLNSAQEWHHLIELIKTHRVIARVMIGLSTAPAYLPDMSVPIRAV